MKLAELEHVTDYTLPASSELSRVQRRRSRRGAVAIGALRLAKGGSMLNRFDLPDKVVGYFASSAETAVYETLARREALFLAMATLAQRMLLQLRTTSELHLLDLRADAGDWPALQALRYEPCQQLAAQARDAGYQGVIYRSAQQYGRDCIALFGGALATVRLMTKLPLVHPASGALHLAAATAVKRAEVPLMP